MNGKYPIDEEDKNKVWIVCSYPCPTALGIMILLEGRHGAYPIDGLRKIEN